MKLHIPGIPHTQTDSKFSHCAFTQKVVKFIPMMRDQAFEVVHYGVGDVNPGANEHVELLTVDEQDRLLGNIPRGPTDFVGAAAHVDQPVYRAFNAKLAKALAARVAPEDVVCLPFGHAHAAGIGTHAGITVETGVGYPTCFLPFRIYESNAWAAWHAGKEQADGSDYHWVIPNYFDVREWKLGPATRQYLAYFGRLTQHKGLDIVKEIAKARPDLDVILCGQGDPKPWLDPQIPNLSYLPPLTGRDRAKFLGNAIALLAPSRYPEPFGGVTIEANLCGTPALTSDFGAFRETIIDNFNGWRCHTLGDWLAAIAWAEALPNHQRAAMHGSAVLQYSFDAIGPQYAQVFAQLADLRADGWFSRTPHFVTTGSGRI